MSQIKKFLLSLALIIHDALFVHMNRSGMILAVALPNGVVLAIATVYGSAKTVSAVTNANPAVATTSAAHGLTPGAFVEVTSGWNNLNGRIVRLSAASGSSATYEGQNTSSVAAFPAGSGIGSFREITTFQQIQQVIGLTYSGGEMQFTNYAFLEEDFERQIPTQSSPITLTLEIADDPALPGYIALAAAAASKLTTGLKMTFPSGSIFLLNGIWSLVPIPKMSKGEIMTVTATFSLQGLPVRYAS